RFALPLRGQSPAVDVGQVAVHVPLDVGDVVLGQQAVEEIVKVVYHLGPAQVKDQLAAAGGRGPARDGQGPVGVGGVEGGVGADHLGLDPQAEQQPHLPHPADQLV